MKVRNKVEKRKRGECRINEQSGCIEMQFIGLM